jgi:tetratricopeptide (TPR) repeat protein
MLETDVNYPEGPEAPQLRPRETSSLPPACQVCGRQDETLRLVILPYVISLVVVTFRRAWVGIFCWRHRLIRQILAGLTTSTLGWLGIPWGFIYTPVALYKLARGGDQPAEDNARMLSELAEYKRQKGDPHAALAIAEEALKLQEGEGVRQQIRALHKDHPLSITRPGPVSPLPFLILLAGASLTGIAVGTVDQLFGYLFNFILGDEVHIVIAILTWAPLVAMIFVGGVAIAELLRWAIERTRMQNMLLAQVLAVITAALGWYGIPQGSLITDYISALIGGYPIGSVGEFLQATGTAVTQGGIWMISDALRTEGGFAVIYLGILLVAGAYYLLTSMATARESVHWLVRLELVEGEQLERHERSLLPAWAAVGGVVIAILLATAVFYDSTSLTGGSPDVVAQLELADTLYSQGDIQGAADAYREVIALDPNLPVGHLNLAWVLYEMGDLEGAAAAFEEAQKLAPQSADTAIGLGFIHLAMDDKEGAETAFQSAIQFSSEPFITGQAYYGLGMIADARFDSDAALAYYEEAVRQDWNMAYAHLDLGLSYHAQADFEKAVEKGNDLMGIASDWAATHALLGMAYQQLDRMDKAQAEAEWAQDLDPQDLYSMLLLANLHYWLRDFDSSRVVLEAAVESYPDSSQAHNILASVYAVMGEYQQAEVLLDDFEARTPGDSYILEARSYIRLQQQDLQAARLLLEQALALDPENPVTQASLSFVMFQLGDAAEALRLADQSLAIYPYSSTTHADRAFALRALGRIDEARTSAEEAVRLSPKADLPHFILGVCYLDLGQTEMGREQLQTFVDLAWDRAYVRDYVAQAQTFLSTLP